LTGPNDATARTGHIDILRGATSSENTVYSQSLSVAGGKNPNVVVNTTLRTFRLEEPCSTGLVTYYVTGYVVNWSGGDGIRLSQYRFLADAKSA